MGVKLSNFLAIRWLKKIFLKVVWKKDYKAVIFKKG